MRIRLFGHLFASGPRASSWREELPPGLATTAGHLAVLLGVIFMLPARPTAEGPPETVTYLDIPPPAAASSPRAVLPPRPPVVRQGLRIPAVLAQVAQPGKLAGFQELVAPARLAGIPPVDASEEAVSALDFSGRGVAGGVAGGQKPEEVPPPTDSTPLAPAGAAYTVATVGEPPVLLNRSELPGIMQSLYPPLLRVAGLSGRVRVEFVVDRAGRVEPRSVRTLESPHPLFSSATQTALEQFRFRPGSVSNGGERRLVPVLVAMTIEWTLRDGGSR
ncbi:MAG TPA: TonB family protein [Gemmatimonadales bacterium]|nr:TonB family protein [Gemmatimonadales bacterium]